MLNCTKIAFMILLHNLNQIIGGTKENLIGGEDLNESARGIGIVIGLDDVRVSLFRQFVERRFDFSE